MALSLELQGVAFAYEKPVLKDVSVGFAAGKFTSILGPNGAGKSTLVKIMSRWYRPLQGNVLVFDRPINDLPQHIVARHIAVVEQENSASTDITVRELVSLGRLPHQGLLSTESAHDHEMIEHSMEVTGVKELSERRLSTLSGGERQRARIAAALAQETEILLLDEPTSHLDIRHQTELLQLLQQFTQRGMTVVSVLHDLNIAALFSDSMVLLGQGEVKAMGSPRDVLRADIIEKVYGCPVTVFDHPLYKIPQIALVTNTLPIKR